MNRAEVWKKMPKWVSKTREILKCGHGPNPTIFYNGYDRGFDECFSILAKKLFDLSCDSTQLEMYKALYEPYEKDRERAVKTAKPWLLDQNPKVEMLVLALEWIANPYKHPERPSTNKNSSSMKAKAVETLINYDDRFEKIFFEKGGCDD